MIENLTYKNKFFLLIVCALILLFLSYILAIRRTVHVIRQKHQNQEVIRLAVEAPHIINDLRNKHNSLTRVLGSNSEVIDNSHILILHKASEYAENHPIIIQNFPEEHIYVEDVYNIKTNILTAQGNFISLLRFLNFLERARNAGRIISSDFYVEKDRYTKRTNLYLKIYMQNITYKKDEK